MQIGIIVAGVASRTSRQTSSTSCSAEPACELQGSAAAARVGFCCRLNATVMAASQGALSRWVSNCLAAKLLLELQRFSGLRAHSVQNLFSAGQVRCLRATRLSVQIGLEIQGLCAAWPNLAQNKSRQSMCTHNCNAVPTPHCPTHTQRNTQPACSCAQTLASIVFESLGLG